MNKINDNLTQQLIESCKNVGGRIDNPDNSKGAVCTVQQGNEYTEVQAEPYSNAVKIMESDEDVQAEVRATEDEEIEVTSHGNTLIAETSNDGNGFKSQIKVTRR